jgi:hypothetical protein
MPSDARRVKIPEQVMMREVSGEAVLLNLATESYFGLDEVGTRMWVALAQSGTVDSAVDRLVAEFDVEPAEVRADLLELIEQLNGAGLISLE